MTEQLSREMRGTPTARLFRLFRPSRRLLVAATLLRRGMRGQFSSRHAGLVPDDLRASGTSVDGREEPLNVFGPEGIRGYLSACLTLP